MRFPKWFGFPDNIAKVSDFKWFSFSIRMERPSKDETNLVAVSSEWFGFPSGEELIFSGRRVTDT